jgi:uncharacterized repeat protein (TIGR03803 family)
VFSFDISTGTHSLIHSFTAGSNGGGPCASLFQASSNRHLYGTASYGGANNRGAIFKIDSGTHAYSVVHSFTTSTGRTPWFDLIEGPGGLLFGTTVSGGNWSLGNIFSFDPNSNVCSSRYNISSTTIVSYPYAGLTYSANGKMYLSTRGGGANSSGTTLEFDPNTNTVVKLTDNTSFGTFQEYNFTVGPDGNLYSQISFALTNGNLIKIDTSNSAVSVEHPLSSYPFGRNPHTISMLQLDDGKVMSTTLNGGTENRGVIFTFDPFTAELEVLYDFSQTTGMNPNATIVKHSSGRFLELQVPEDYLLGEYFLRLTLAMVIILLFITFQVQAQEEPQMT